MRAVVGQDWGADKQALMRQTIDYGCFVYGSAAKTHLKIKKTDRVIISPKHLVQHFIAGEMRSTPTKAIQVELGEVPFDIIKDKRILTYWSWLQGCDNENHTKNVIQECWEYNKI